MKRILLAGLLLYSAISAAYDYGPPQNWRGPGISYHEGGYDYYHQYPRYHENYEYRYRYRAPFRGWSCVWSSNLGWGCNVWYPIPPVRPGW